MVTASSLNH